MSDTYVRLKIREALKASGGNRGMAHRRLVALALEDEQLLRGLTMPFLKAIAGSAVERTARELGLPSSPRAANVGPSSSTRPNPLGRPAKRLSNAALDALVLSLDRAPSAPSAPVPQVTEKAAPPVQQASALKTLAAAYRRRS